MWKQVKAWFGKAPARDAAVETYAVSDLYPLLIPKEFFATGLWVGPVVELGAEGLDLTWAVRTPPNLVNYLNRDMIASWERQGVDWRAAAMENLACLATDSPWSEELMDDEGRLVLVVFLHGLLDAVFPNGYEVAVPELTCALAIGRVSGEEDPRVEQMIQGCFEHGTRPVSPKRYAPEVFWRP